MRSARFSAIASVLLTFVALAPFTAWGADGIEVGKALTEDVGNFDNMLGQTARSRPAASTNARAAARAAFGTKVTNEARKAKAVRERAIVDSKNLGSWTKTNNTPGGQGSPATVVGGDGSAGSYNPAQSARDSSFGTNHGHGNGNSQ
jgi:hypothetical protein